MTHQPTITLTLHDAPLDDSTGIVEATHASPLLRSHRLALYCMRSFLQPVRHNFVYHHDTAFD